MRGFNWLSIQSVKCVMIIHLSEDKQTEASAPQSDHQAGEPGYPDGNQYMPYRPRESAGSSASLKNTSEKFQVRNSHTYGSQNWWPLQKSGSPGNEGQNEN